MKNSLVVISHPRSGSTYFGSLLKQFKELKVYLEVFHFDQEVVEQHMFGDWGKVRARLLARGVCTGDCFPGYKEDPSAFLNELTALNEGKTVSFKVFPGHLSHSALDTCLNGNGVFFLYRNIVDAHISNEIARQTGKYANFDTSQEKITFKLDEFLLFARGISKHFRNALSVCETRGITPVLVNYKETLNEGFLSKLKNQLEITLDRPLTVSEGSNTITKRQDTRTAATDKVMNPDEMIELLDSRQINLLNADILEARNADELTSRLENFVLD